MSKVASVLEKLKLMEKTSEVAADISDENLYNSQPEIQSKTIQEDKNKPEYQYSDAQEESENAKGEVRYKPDLRKKGNLTIEEIYSLYSIENSKVNTIFMLGNFIDAIPESLPHEVRRKSVVSIIESSETNMDKLLDDGKKRLEALNQFSHEYSKQTTDTIEEYKKKIADLKKLISNFEDQIRINENLLKEQNSIIKYENEKVKSIIDFINNVD